MFNLELYYAKKKRSVVIPFPQQWDELTTPEVEHICSLLVPGTTDMYEARASILVKILELRSKDKNIVRKLWPEEVAMDGLQLVDFTINSNLLTVQPYPTIGSYTGTKNNFNDMTVAAYEDAFVQFINYKEDPKLEHLAALACILYRKDGAPYITYNVQQAKNVLYELDEHQAFFMNLPPVQLYTIFTWFTGCQAMLQLIFKEVYNGGSGDGQPDIMAFTKCIHAAAGPKNGTRDMIRRLLLKELLFDMNQEAIQANEMIEKYGKGKS